MANFRKTIFSTLLASVIALGGVANAETATQSGEKATTEQSVKAQRKAEHLARLQERKQQHIDEFNKATISATDAIKTATTKVAGEVMGVHFGTSNGLGYYRVDIFKDDKPESVNVDAKTGEVITYRLADDRPPMARHQDKNGRHQGKEDRFAKEKDKKGKDFDSPKTFKKPDVTISLEQAIHSAVEKSGGKVVTARLDGFHRSKDASPTYHIVTLKEGKPFRTIVDGKTGEVKESKALSKPEGTEKPEA